ncbi:VID27 cytoplasmic protein-domain-containing protein [Pisolithus croceorrhizus]|nr:VID27 cytoplasmic protein-domain-containing protein [Pisolithus croceorrhizus]
MNIFRSLIAKVWRSPTLPRWSRSSPVSLYLVRPGNIRSSRECIYNEAIATIRRVPSIDHNFQLVITRVYEEGDQELLEDEDESMVFLISQELEFRRGAGEADNQATFVWRDLDGDVDELYEFVMTEETNEPTRAFFETCMYRAMYERKYKMSADNIGDQDLSEFTWKPPAPKRAGTGKKAPLVASESASPDGITRAFYPNKIKAMPANTATVVEEDAQFFVWDVEVDGFVSAHDDFLRAKILESTSNDYKYWIVATDEQEDLIMHKIAADMNPRWSPKTQSVTWNFYVDGAYGSWAFQFNSSDAYENFKVAFARAAWETLHHTPFNKIKPDEQAYVLSATNEDVEMRDAQNEDEDEEEVVSELDPDEEPSEDEEEEEGNASPQLQGERNSQLTIGYKGDRSYVVRGNNIGVFSHAGRNQVKYYATISKVSTPKGREFKPREVMLHDQDTKMVLMNPAEPHSLYNMDIERGKVVEEWKVHEDVTVDHIAPDNKFAQMTPEQTLIPRISGLKMVDSQYKQYVSKNRFSGVATTSSGKLAVASAKGDIRLFDSIGKNAKTALPPLGDPIIGIDVTADGRWIVATTKAYLLLIDTLIGEGRYAGSLGFDRSFPANAKPMPRRLQLRSEHVAYMNQEVNFLARPNDTTRFNQGEGQVENAIVTSTGQYVVAWDFAKVKKGQLDKYEIKKYEDTVVQDNFKFGDDKEIIVALENNVLAINKKNLKRPTRASLVGPMTGLHHRSSIVNSPY